MAVSDDSAYIGITINDFVAEGNEHSGYIGFNGQYEFYAINEDLIGNCTITQIEAQQADATIYDIKREKRRNQRFSCFIPS